MCGLVVTPSARQDETFSDYPCNGDSSRTCIDFKQSTHSINFDINDETFWVFVEVRLF